jgi:hypothetical protein
MAHQGHMEHCSEGEEPGSLRCPAVYCGVQHYAMGHWEVSAPAQGYGDAAGCVMMETNHGLRNEYLNSKQGRAEFGDDAE